MTVNEEKMICAVSAVMLLTLSGCGLKGPLYFPPEEPAAAKARLQPSLRQSSLLCRLTTLRPAKRKNDHRITPVTEA